MKELDDDSSVDIVKLAEFCSYIEEKFSSGNNIPVERITLTRKEVENYFNLGK